MNKVRLYTKTGDKGETSLFGGKRIKKDDRRIEVYGTIDELNAALGAANSFIKTKKSKQIVSTIQNELFNIGAELANPQKISRDTKDLFVLNESKVIELENIIDQYDKNLPPLKSFIIPGGTSGASLIHLSRSIVRRAERTLITLSKKDRINPNILAYLNRLSDLLFVMARHLNHEARIKDSLWKK